MTGRLEIDLPYPRPPLNMNQRMHWAPKAKITRQIVDDVQVLAAAARVPRGLERVEIVLHWQPTVRRRRDSDNPTPTLKAAIDGLARYGLVPDDNSLHVVSGVSIEPVGPQPRLWLTIIDLAVLSGVRPDDQDGAA